MDCSSDFVMIIQTKKKKGVLGALHFEETELKNPLSTWMKQDHEWELDLFPELKESTFSNLEKLQD